MYNEDNEAIGVDDLKTDGDTRKRSLTNVVGAEVDNGGKYKVHEKVYQLPNQPGSAKQLHALPMIWQGTDFHQPPDTATLKITARLVWSHNMIKMGGRTFPATHYYIVWEFPLCGQEGKTMYSPKRKEKARDEDDIAASLNRFLNFRS